MEQDVQNEDKLLLRFKYHVFFDLDPKVGEQKEPARLMVFTKSPEQRTRIKVCVCVCLLCCSMMLSESHNYTNKLAGTSCWRRLTVLRRRC